MPDPCGSPNLTDDMAEVDAAQRTDFVRSVRYDLNHKSTSCSRPYVMCNRRSSIVWSTVSNAADRSFSVSSDTSPPSAARRMSQSTYYLALSLLRMTTRNHVWSNNGDIANDLE